MQHLRKRYGRPPLPAARKRFLAGGARPERAGEPSWSGRSGPSGGTCYPAGCTLDAIATVPCELVTLWRTKADLLAGLERVDRSIPEALQGTLSSRAAQRHDLSGPLKEKDLHTERGEFVLRA